jgi:peptide-methionine (S)-S-oxide reductase
MNPRLLRASLAILTWFSFTAICRAQDTAGTPPAKAESETTKESPKETKAAVKKKSNQATFAAGCFWSTEAVFERIPGVISVTSGYCGGAVPNPSYQMVSTGQTGHAESVHIVFNPQVVTYETLLHYFWNSHDPTTVNAQGDDFGPQYRSVIFYHDEDQKEAALKSYKALMAKRKNKPPIVTELNQFRVFYPAEEYHQDYLENHIGSTYTMLYIEPKLSKLHLLGKPRRTTRTAARTAKSRTNPASSSPAPDQSAPK